MKRNAIVPEHVRETPSGFNGNGFVIGGMWAATMVGSDGNIYTRKEGKIFIAPEDEDDEF